MDAFTQEMKNLLEQEKKDIQEKIKQTQEDLKNGEDAQGDDCDVANASDALKTKEIFNAIDSKKIKAIDGALKRISEGRYGYCLQCGKRIPEGRLRAMPSAVLCVECKSISEKMM